MSFYGENIQIILDQRINLFCSRVLDMFFLSDIFQGRVRKTINCIVGRLLRSGDERSFLSSPASFMKSSSFPLGIFHPSSERKVLFLFDCYSGKCLSLAHKCHQKAKS